MNVRRVSRCPRIEASFNPPSSYSNGSSPSPAIFYESCKQIKEVGLDFRGSEGQTIYVADAHRGDGRRFVVHADEKLTAFIELESAIRACCKLC
jgi:hypothetical protein